MAESSNMKAHENTYVRMIGMMKWGAVGVAIITAIVLWLIAA